MKPWQMATGVGILGAIAAGWGQIKGLLGRIRSLVIVRAELDPHLTTALAAWCWKHAKHSRFGDRKYIGFWVFILGQDDRCVLIPAEDSARHAALFWHGWRPLWISGAANKAPTGGGQPGKGSENFTIAFIRGTFDIEKILAEACQLIVKRTRRATGHKRFSVIRLFGLGPPEARSPRGDQPPPDGPPAYEVSQGSNGSPLGEWRPIGVALDNIRWESCGDQDADPMASLAFPEEVDELIAEAQRWLQSKRWHQEKGVPWRRGWLLHGTPGTGKTSLARALAWKLDLPVYCFDLSGMSNKELVQHWAKARAASPCIALIEDLDAVFEGRTNRVGRNGGGLTFDCLLNCISGIQSSDGMFLIATTNNGAALDDALLRAGRLDRTLELGPIDEPCRRRIAQRILSECTDLIDQAVNDGKGDTPAAFTDRCAQIALKHFWAGKA